MHVANHALVSVVRQHMATPWPPGKMSASSSLSRTLAMSRNWPRAMRAASAGTRRGLAPGSTLPLRWSTTRAWVRSGARHTGSAPPRSSDRSVRTASRTSEPSPEPQPDRTTPTHLAMATALAGFSTESKAESLRSRSHHRDHRAHRVGPERPHCTTYSASRPSTIAWRAPRTSVR
jgi:hypothetical protein